MVIDALPPPLGSDFKPATAISVVLPADFAVGGLEKRPVMLAQAACSSGNFRGGASSAAKVVRAVSSDRTNARARGSWRDAGVMVVRIAEACELVILRYSEGPLVPRATTNGIVSD